MGWDLFGAFVVTFFVSRAALLIVRSRSLPALLVAHIGSWAVIALVLGLLRSNIYRDFDLQAGLIYIVPQVCWLFLDLARAGHLNVAATRR